MKKLLISEMFKSGRFICGQIPGKCLKTVS